MKYNFYPGPSKIYPQVAGYFQEAMDLGILERNHRSVAFQDLYASTKVLLKSKLNIPLDYEIAVVSSATECWEIIAQSLTRNKSYHFYNGAFGEKWWRYAQKIHSDCESIVFQSNGEPIFESLNKDAELVALTHNETSNGTAIPIRIQRQLRKQFPNTLIAYDATSSMAGYDLEWENGDVWFASVQKCFGLPAGMALMICSPLAIERAKEINDRSHYNSFNLILENTLNNQTHHTPNIANVFLLNRILKNIENISAVTQNLKNRKDQFYKELLKVESLRPLVASEDYRSETVFCLKGEHEVIREIEKQAEKEAIVLGKGYGIWKSDTIRIANFPAIVNRDYIDLINFLLGF